MGQLDAFTALISSVMKVLILARVAVRRKLDVLELELGPGKEGSTCDIETFSFSPHFWFIPGLSEVSI